MVGYGARSIQKMEQAIAALLSSRNVEEAARKAGMGTNTLRRWMKRPEFKAAYQQLQAALLSQAIARLQEASGAAVTTILKVMLDPHAPASARLRAAEIVLEQATKASSSNDLEVRLANLERNAGPKQSSRGSPTAITLVKIRTQLAPLPAHAATQQDGTDSDEGGKD